MARQKSVKLLLVENVENLGIVGDVVNVRPGYARNYLVPMRLATVPTPTALKRVEARRAEVERELAALRKVREDLVQKLQGLEITLQRSANPAGHLFGSVVNTDIVLALAELGHTITERDVRIGGPIKQIDTYEIPIVFEKDLSATIKLWVVSDKPLDELDTEELEEAVAEAPKSKRKEKAENKQKAEGEKAEAKKPEGKDKDSDDPKDKKSKGGKRKDKAAADMEF